MKNEKDVVVYKDNSGYLALKNVYRFWKTTREEKPSIAYEVLSIPPTQYLTFENVEARDKCFKKMEDYILHERKGNMLQDLFKGAREYINENRDLVWTVVLAVLLDHFLFEGAFRERIKGIVEGFLKKAEAKHTAGV